MRDALNATGRPIVFSLCGWNPWYSNPDPSLGYGGGKTLGNLWRIGPDDTNWAGVLSKSSSLLLPAVSRKEVQTEVLHSQYQHQLGAREERRTGWLERPVPVAGGGLPREPADDSAPIQGAIQ